MKYLIFSLMILSGGLSHADTFFCTAMVGEDLYLQVALDGSTVSAITGSETAAINAVSYVGDLDLSYKPKVAGSVRYIVRDSGSDKTQIILSPNIMRGLAGKMRVQGKTDGFWSETYTCK